MFCILGTRIYITNETEWHLFCRCHDNSYVAGPVLITTKIPRFYLEQGSSTPNDLIGRVTCKTIIIGGIWFFFGCSQKETRALINYYCHVSNIHAVHVFLFLLWCSVLVSSLKSTAQIILEIFLIYSWTIYGVIAFLICIIRKCEFLQTKKNVFQRGNCHSSLLRETVQIGSNYFLPRLQALKVERHLN